MNFLTYSTGIKNLLAGIVTEEVAEIIKGLSIGEKKIVFSFLLGERTIKIISPFTDIQSIFEVLNRASPQREYDLSLRILVGGKTKFLSKRGYPEIPVDRIKKNLSYGADKIYYEILSTNDFEITSSEYEGLVIKCDDLIKLKRYFRLLVGLFPFVEFKKDSKRIKIECIFDVENIQRVNETKKKGFLKCIIFVDEEQIGIKSKAFIF